MLNANRIGLFWFQLFAAFQIDTESFGLHNQHNTGYHITDTVKTEWEAATGVVYQGSQFAYAEPEHGQNNTTPVLAISTLSLRVDY